jgi:hypothetical protein
MGVRPAWETPDALIKRVSSDVLESIKTDRLCKLVKPAASSAG